MVPIARRNLFAEKARLLIAVGGVGVAVLLVLIVLSLYRGWSQTGQIFQEMPGQLWAVQHGTSDPFHSISLVEPADLRAASQVPGVQAVVPVLSRQMTFAAGGEEESVRLMALRFPEGFEMSPDVRERFAPAPGEIIIDSTLSRKTGLGRGDTATFGDVSLNVADVRPRSTEVLTTFAFVHFDDAQRIFGVGDVVTYGMVVLADGADAQAVARGISERVPRLQLFTAGEFAESIRKEIDEGFLPVITILLAIGFAVGSAVVGLTIYTATIERTREYGVMKAIGASAGFLYRIVLSQSALVTAAGFVAGLAGALVVARLAEQAVPEFATVFRWQDIAAAFGATLLMSAVAALLPIRRVAAVDPAVVFRA